MADFFGVDLRWHTEHEFYRVDGQYHLDTVGYAPGTNRQGDYAVARPSNELYGIEDGRYHNAGSFLGIDGLRHEANDFYGVDGQFHQPDARYDGTTGKYTDITS